MSRDLKSERTGHVVICRVPAQRSLDGSTLAILACQQGGQLWLEWHESRECGWWGEWQVKRGPKSCSTFTEVVKFEIHFEGRAGTSAD